jgi:SAM-dependent methyltransferase
MKYEKKKLCRCCLSNDLLLYLDLGKQPLANSYHKGEKLPTAPLEVMLCRNCFHNQLSVVVDPDAMFKDYLYVSGTTQTFRDHTRELAKDAVKRFKTKNLSVMDIACNDGTQLEFFRDLGCDAYGVDPAKNLRSITRKKKIPVVVDYWTSKIANKFKNKFDIMTGTNVFAHVDDVDEFLTASKIALKDDGLLILEFPYADNMVKHNEFDTVYHEHLSYFLVNSFKTLANRMGFSIVDVLRTSIHGGSIRFFLKKGEHKESIKVKRLIDDEKNSGLLKEKTYIKYADQVAKNKEQMKKLLDQIKKEKKKIIGYGASAKGNTMLNYFKINFSYVVDDNDLKQGYLTPGRNILIKNPAVLAEEKEDFYIVILAWNFYNEIASRIKRIRKNKKDKAIVYVPKVEVRPINSNKKYIQSA